MHSSDELFMRSLEFYFAVYSINTKITLEWAYQHFVTRVHTLFYIHFTPHFIRYVITYPVWYGALSRNQWQLIVNGRANRNRIIFIYRRNTNVSNIEKYWNFVKSKKPNIYYIYNWITTCQTYKRQWNWNQDTSFVKGMLFEMLAAK